MIRGFRPETVKIFQTFSEGLTVVGAERLRFKHSNKEKKKGQSRMLASTDQRVAAAAAVFAAGASILIKY